VVPHSALSFLVCWCVGLALLPAILRPSVCQAAPKVMDYQSHLPRTFKKHRRASTRFIIIHSTESGLKSALRSLSKGGYANYLIAPNGTIYRILDKLYRADHAGLSMWNGLTDISSHSIGIELVGYHNDPFTDKQYNALKWLIGVLQKQYGIPDWHVLEHFRVAYGEPNRYVKQRHRGRKKDPGIFNFDRARAGLTAADERNSVLYDPDVTARRLIADPDIDIARLKVRDKKKYEEAVADLSTNVITAANTAWRVARDDYDQPTTVYEFPDGTVRRGHEITDWLNIPPGTRVFLNRPVEEEADRVAAAVPVITEGLTAVDIAGTAYRRFDTYYIFPKGTVKHGRQIRQWSSIPPGTRVLIGYEKPVPFRKSDRKKASVQKAAQLPHTVFLVAKGRVLTAGQIPDFTKLASDTLMFVKK
jgi:hypothetical protein